MHMQETSSMASKDQRTLDADVKENKWEKYNRGLDLYIESVHKPDNQLRSCAHNQKCYNELMQVREEVLRYLHTLRRSNANQARKTTFDSENSEGVYSQ